MKDDRFKELLNLHLDHRLSETEAAELEAALQADPARRKTLRSYEAMQGACCALFAKEAARAPSSEALSRALRLAEERIENPGSFRQAWGWPTWGVTAGMAACVALVVARLSQPTMMTAEISKEAGDGVSVAAVAAEPVLVAAAAAQTRRAQMPNQIAFAALGLAPSSANADAASRWILEADETAAYANVEPAVAESAPVWGRVETTGYSTESRFSARPINAWGRSASGFQVETAGYRFER